MKHLFIIISILFLFPSFAKDHTYEVDGKEFQGYVINKGKSSPLVFIIHDWDGLDGYEIKRAQMLAKLGYSVFALDMFGKGIRPSSIAKRKELTGALYKNRKMMRKLMNASYNVAKSLGLNTQNATVVGYCFGGTSVLEWAKSGANLRGFASFHGDMSVNEGDSYSKTKGSIIVFHGSADKVVSMQSFADFAVLAQKENVKHEMITYSGARHAFTKFGSDRYNKYADLKSWERYTSFLEELK